MTLKVIIVSVFVKSYYDKKYEKVAVLRCLIRCLFQVNEELMESGLFEVMDINTDEDEHSIEMQLPYIAKAMEG